MQTKFSSIENVIRKKLNTLYEKIGHRSSNQPSHDYEDDCIEDDESASTQFLRTQKNKLIELLEHYERYVNTLPVFGFNSGKYDLNLIKTYLIPYLINDRNIQPTVIKKSNNFISFKFGNVQFLDILNFLGGASSLDSFLKAYKTSETKGYFPYEWFNSPDKLDQTGLPSYESFFSKLKNYNPLEKEYNDYKALIDSGSSHEVALIKLRLKTTPPTGKANYNYLQEIWNSHKMKTFKNFLK